MPVDVSFGSESAVHTTELVHELVRRFPTFGLISLLACHYLGGLGPAKVFTGGVTLWRHHARYQLPAAAGSPQRYGDGRYLRKEDVPIVMPFGQRQPDLCIHPGPALSNQQLGKVLISYTGRAQSLPRRPSGFASRHFRLRRVPLPLLLARPATSRIRHVLAGLAVVDAFTQPTPIASRINSLPRPIPDSNADDYDHELSPTCCTRNATTAEASWLRESQTQPLGRVKGHRGRRDRQSSLTSPRGAAMPATD